MTEFNETKYKELQRQFHIEWLERKANRQAKASQNAKVLGRLSHNGCIIEIRRDMRSRGADSDYKRVPQYWILIYKEGKLIESRSLTERAYQEAKAKAYEHSKITLP